MARKSGILSDEHYYKNCLEYQNMKIGLAQRMFPLKQSVLPGVPIPSVLPVAQRGYNLTRSAISLSQRTGRPVNDIIEILLKESKEIEIKRVFRPIVRVEQGGQASLLAKKVTQRESDIDQLNRAFVTPEGVVVAKTGRIDEFMVREPEDDSNDSTGPTGAMLPPDERM